MEKKQKDILNKLTERNNAMVRTMAAEIKYLCEEAVDHQYGFNNFKAMLLSRIDIEQKFNDFDKIDF